MVQRLILKLLSLQIMTAAIARMFEMRTETQLTHLRKVHTEKQKAF